MLCWELINLTIEDSFKLVQTWIVLPSICSKRRRNFNRYVFGESSLLETCQWYRLQCALGRVVDENEVDICVTLDGLHWANEVSLLWIIFFTHKPTLSEGTELLKQTLVLNLCNPMQEAPDLWFLPTPDLCFPLLVIGLTLSCITSGYRIGTAMLVISFCYSK